MTRRRYPPEPTHEMIQFIDYSEAEVDLYVLLAEQYGLRLVAKEVRREVLRQMSIEEDIVDADFWERLGAKSRSGLRLDAETDILVAMEEWKRDTRHYTDLLNCAERDGKRLKSEELTTMIRRIVGWDWFWSIRSPDPLRRERFAESAQMGEAILAKKGN